MTIIDALILGLIQGLTEFIPVSSSGHLIIFNELWTLESTFTYDILLNIGTVTAAVVYFRREVASLFRFRTNNNLTRNIIITTLPAVVIGVVIGELFDEASREVTLSAIMLVVVGVLFLFENTLRRGQQGIDGMRLRTAVVIGLAQAVALIPGTSRSGATILAARQQGLNRETAARYSFLASIPIIGGAIVYSLLFKTENIAAIDPLLIVVGIGASFVSSMVAIHFMIKALKRIGLVPFGIYRVVLGLMLLFIA